MKPDALGSGLAVVIPAFNSAATIARAIQSAISTCAVQVVVVDDGSTDSTAEIALRWGCQVVRQANQGAAMARRNGLLRVTAGFVLYLDADDELESAGIKEAVEALSRGGSLVGVIGRTRVRSELGPDSFIDVWEEGVDVPSLLARSQAPGPPASFMWRRSSLENAYSLHPGRAWPDYAEDYELILRMAMQGGIASLDVIMSCYAPDGGRSALAPRRDASASEEIRRYYAGQAGINIRERSPADLRATATLREAFRISGSGRPFRRNMLFVKGFLISPQLFVHLAFRRRGRRDGTRRPARERA